MLDELKNTREDFVDPWLGIIFLTMGVLIAFISHNFRAHIRTVLLANFVSRELTNHKRDESNKTRKANIWLNSFFLLNVTIIFYVFALKTSITFGLSNGLFFLVCLGSVFGWYFIKYLVQYFIGITFKMKELTISYIEQSTIKDKAFGILIFPLVILTVFNRELSDIVFYGILIISVIYLFFRWINGVVLGIRQGNIPFLYSILYICTLEILPVVLAVKIFLEPIMSSLA